VVVGYHGGFEGLWYISEHAAISPGLLGEDGHIAFTLALNSMHFSF
jgi:hypothetical protein